MENVLLENSFHLFVVLDYVQCPYCQRTFNQHAGERHIKFCQEQAARMPRKGKLADEKKPPARTQVSLTVLKFFFFSSTNTGGMIPLSNVTET